MQKKITFYPCEVLVEPMMGKVYNIVDERTILMKLILNHHNLLKQNWQYNLQTCTFILSISYSLN
jgi:hypothetical protein